MNINDVIIGANNGTLNPKQTVRQMLSGMSPEQRQRFNSMMPMAERLAQKFGVSLPSQNELQFTIQNQSERMMNNG